MGAQVIEKHFTLDKSLPGPDQKASLDPAEFAAMVLAVRHAVENRDTFFPLLEEDDAEQALTAFYQPWLGEEAGDAARYILGVSLRTLTRASADDLLKRLKDVEALLQKLEGNLAAIVKTTRASTEATLKTLAAAQTAHKGR